MDRISRWAVSAWKLRTAWELWFFGGVLAVVWWQTVEDNIGGKPMIDALSAARSTLGTLTQNGFVQLALLVAAAGLFWRGVLRLSRVELQALERKAQLDADLLRPLIASFESHRIAMSSLVSDATKLPHLCAALVPLEAKRDRLTAKRQEAFDLLSTYAEFQAEALAGVLAIERHSEPRHMQFGRMNSRIGAGLNELGDHAASHRGDNGLVHRLRVGHFEDTSMPFAADRNPALMAATTENIVELTRITESFDAALRDTDARIAETRGYIATETKRLNGDRTF